jgi:hypothetical protein
MTHENSNPPRLEKLSFRRPRGEVEADGEAARFERAQRDPAAENAEQTVGDDEAQLVHVSAALVRGVHVYGVEEV